MRRLAFFLVLSLFITSLFSAESFLPKSFRIEFSQVYKSTLSGRERKLKSSLDYLYPSMFRFDYSDKRTKLLVSDGIDSYRYTSPFIKGEKGQLIITSGNSLPLARFFDLLQPGLVNTKDYKTVINGAEVVITFSAKSSKLLELKELKIHFLAVDKIQFSEIQGIDLIGMNGDQTNLVINKIEKTTYKDSFFEFEIPENTQVSRR